MQTLEQLKRIHGQQYNRSTLLLYGESIAWILQNRVQHGLSEKNNYENNSIY